MYEANLVVLVVSSTLKFNGIYPVIKITKLIII
jgi:hypothetical protein